MDKPKAADIKQAVDVMDAAAKLPSPDVVVLRNLALLLTNEEMAGFPTLAERRAAGVKVDPKRAEELMRQAASRGDAAARAWCERKGVKYIEQ